MSFSATVPPELFAVSNGRLVERREQEAGWEVRDDLTTLAIDDAWVRPSTDADAAAAAERREARQ